MREIKFRVYNKTQAKMSAPFTLIDLMCVEVPLLSGSVMTDEIEWLQYTGLKDKNGVEIYEGDVMRWHNSLVPKGADPTALSTVRWSNRYAMFDGIRRTGEVIGNKYENPELVKDNV